MNTQIKKILSKVLLSLAALTCVASTQAAEAKINANAVGIEVIPSQSIVQAGHRQRIFVKVGLTGAGYQHKHRAPANIAIVLDKSGSMSGIKMIRAKEAAIMAIHRLGRQDTVSVIAYSGHVEIIQPATHATDRELVTESIRRIYAGGSTALFAGVTRGAVELRKYLKRNQINRVILLSDGQANIGPQSPHELGQLGTQLADEGISVTTIGLGLGYNEDLMTMLAKHSGGNHAFVENANDLARIFNHEFNDVLSVVATNAIIKINCKPGVRPIRVFGHKAIIKGDKVEIKINQIYAKQQKYIIMELEIPASKSRHGRNLSLANITTSYIDVKSKKSISHNNALQLKADKSRAIASKSLNNKVMSSAVEYIAIEKSRRAIKLRDAGRMAEAKAQLIKNSAYLRSNAKRYKSKKLEAYAEKTNKAAATMDKRQWNRTRKLMRKDNHSRGAQQSF